MDSGCKVDHATTHGGFRSSGVIAAITWGPDATTQINIPKCSNQMSGMKDFCDAGDIETGVS